MSRYAWIITQDLINPNAKPVSGPSDCAWTPNQIASHTDARDFRMLDDDDNVCCIGILVDPDDEYYLGPLDDWGKPSLGCTAIQYWIQGEWQTI